MNLKHRLRSLELAIPLGPRCFDEMQSAYGIWNKAVAHDAPACGVVLGCIIRCKMNDPGPYDTPLSDEERKAFTEWAAGFEKKHSKTLEEMRDELERAGIIRQMRRDLKASLKR